MGLWFAGGCRNWWSCGEKPLRRGGKDQQPRFKLRAFLCLHPMPSSPYPGAEGGKEESISLLLLMQSLWLDVAVLGLSSRSWCGMASPEAAACGLHRCCEPQCIVLLRHWVMQGARCSGAW